MTWRRPLMPCSSPPGSILNNTVLDTPRHGLLFQHYHYQMWRRWFVQWQIDWSQLCWQRTSQNSPSSTGRDNAYRDYLFDVVVVVVETVHSVPVFLTQNFQLEPCNLHVRIHCKIHKNATQLIHLTIICVCLFVMYSADVDTRFCVRKKCVTQWNLSKPQKSYLKILISPPTIIVWVGPRYMTPLVHMISTFASKTITNRNDTLHIVSSIVCWRAILICFLTSTFNQ